MYFSETRFNLMFGDSRAYSTCCICIYVYVCVYECKCKYTYVYMYTFSDSLSPGFCFVRMHRLGARTVGTSLVVTWWVCPLLVVHFLKDSPQKFPLQSRGH